MTLFGLLKLIRHNLAVVIAVPLVCMLIAGGSAFFSPAIYSTRATFITDGDVFYGRGLAEIEASDYVVPDDLLAIAVDSSEDSMQVFVYVSDFDEAHAMQVANDVVNATVASIRTIDSTSNIQVNEASSSTEERESIPKGLAAGLLVGLVLAACYLVLVDLVKAPIKSREEVQNLSELPVLGDVGADDDQLFVNLRFRGGKDMRSITVVPLADGDEALSVANQLASSFEKVGFSTVCAQVPADAEEPLPAPSVDGVTIYCCEPLAAGMGVAIAGHASDAVVLYVREWRDNKRQLAATIQELDLAGANLVGIAYAPEGKKHQRA